MPLMRKPQPDEVTNLQLAWSEGDRQAFDKRSVSVQAELRKRAHFFGIALDVSVGTVKRDWLAAKVWLRHASRRESPQ